jgi:hypothetical protein
VLVADISRHKKDFPMKQFLRAAVVAVAPIFIQPTPVSILPSDDGYVLPPYVITEDYLIAGDADYQGLGVVEFPMHDVKHNVDSALLAVNPYGLPLNTTVMNVYGYESKNGRVDVSDATAGVLLGQWNVPADIDYGEETFFDVTDFLRTVKSKYVGFRLQAVPHGTYFLFSSLEYNLGTPARLIVTPCSKKNHC